MLKVENSINTLSPTSCIWEQKDRQRNALLGDLGPD